MVHLQHAAGSASRPRVEIPSRRSLFALDALFLLLADVRGGLAPFLAVYLASVHHWDASRIGLALAVMGTAGLVAQTPAGALIDGLKGKRGIIASGLALVGVASLTMVLDPSPTIVLASQAIIGAAGSVFAPALAAVSLGLVGRAGLARRLGRNQALDHTGNVVAAAMAGWVGETLGYGAVFVLASIFCLLGMVATSFLRGDEIDALRARGADEGVSRHAADDPIESRRPQVAALSSLLHDRRILVFGGAVILFHFANAAMLPLVGQKLAAVSSRGAAGSMSAAIIAAQVVMIPVALVASRFAETWGRKPTLLIAFAVLPIRGVLSSVSEHSRFLVAVQLLDGVGAGVIGVVGVLAIADLTRGTGRFNLMQGALATATGIGAVMSNLVTGFVVDAAGFDAGFLTLAAIAGVALGFFALAMPETLEPRSEAVPRPAVRSIIDTSSC